MTTQAGRDEASSTRAPGASRALAYEDVAVLFVLALTLRIVAVGRTAVIFNDGPIFLALAGLMEDGQFAEAVAHAYHPLYPILIAALRFGSLEAETVAISLSVVSGSLAVLALHALLVQAWDRRVAFVGAFMLAVHPYAVRFSADVQSDALYLLLFLAGVACVYSALRDHRVGRAFVAGMLSGAAYLTRPEGVGIILVGTTLASVAWLRGGWSTRATLSWLGGLWSGALLLTLPYVGVMQGLAGQWRFTQKKSIPMLLGLDPTSPEWPVLPSDEGGFTLWGLGVLAVVIVAVLVLAIRSLVALRPSSAPPVRVGSRTLVIAALALCGLALIVAPEALPIFFAAIVSTLRPELMLMLVVGVGIRSRDEPQGRSLFVLLFMGLYAVVLFLLLVQYGYLSRRHVLPPLTLVFGYAATGLLICAEAIRSRFAGRRWALQLDAPHLAGVLLGLVAAIGLPKAWHDHRGEELAGRLAAEWLATEIDARGLVAANRSKLGYYAQKVWKPLRGEDGSPRPLDILWAEHVRFVIAEDDLLTKDARPSSKLPVRPGYLLRMRHRAEARGRSAVVFEIVRSRQTS